MKNIELFQKDGEISIGELKEVFCANDFSTLVSRYDFDKASSEDNTIYKRVKRQFRDTWNANLKELIGKKSLVNFSKDHPVRCLEKKEEDLVAGTVMELLHNEAHCSILFDFVFCRVKEKLIAHMEEYAVAHDETIAELTGGEVQFVLHDFFDSLYGYMMKILLQVQNVPEIMALTTEMPAHEDFNDSIQENYNKIDFVRSWYHLRTKTGCMLSLSDLLKDEYADSDEARVSEKSKSESERAEEAKYEELMKEFCESLGDGNDSKIVCMREEGLTQEEIAQRLGYANHSAVSKRITKLYEKYVAFLISKEKEEAKEE